ncbi:18533_t:CDS:2 [Dentiscutata erythropus]|uniref:18533_t:CDS:1 n=1 Tax=Dentiscutata erythropus TaxID=1348616 RepID=A0A9N9JER6_9GLOM|nr:18533_t:CDS:2 [Dentiscutata erythropus]
MTNADSQPPNSIITMWILLEGKKRAVQVDLDQINYENRSLNLDRLTLVLKEEFNELLNIERSDIEFFSLNGHNTLTPLRSGTLLTEIVTTDIAPLVVRTDSNDHGGRFLDLKIQIKGKKAYGDWTLKEVSKEIYNDAFDSIESMQIFEIHEIFKLDPPLNDDGLKRFEDNLREKMNIFHNEVTTNEATAREFISVFLSLAVNHVRACNDPSTRLKVEVELDGSRGYGVLDYGVYIQKIPVLVTEAKPYESEKAIAQTLVQIHSAAESLLGKRKRSEQTMFGIVTTGRSWRFIRWNGSLECPKAEITQEYPCIFENDMKEAKRVVSYIVCVLQAQAKSLNKEKPCAKRLCTDDKLG